MCLFSTEQVDVLTTYRTVVLASGNGSNLQAVIDAVAEKRIPLDLVSLIVNRADAYALERAKAATIPVVTLLWDRAVMSRADFDTMVLNAVAAARPDLVLLLGWMHVLPLAFFTMFPHVMNVHPAFLPLDSRLDTVTMPDGEVMRAFRGTRAIDDGIAAGARWFGVSVHWVSEEVDRGEILVRAPLLRGLRETREALIERIHTLEHHCLVKGIERWTAMDRKP
jgi:phosphoribosylglycinamide formyltransferase-1